MGPHDTAGLTIVAICGSLGPTLAVVASHVLSQRALRRVAAVAESTHTLCNSQRTLMLRALNVLTARIARENPADQDAQLAAEKAARDLEDAERA